MRRGHVQFVRYCVVGGAALAADVGSFWAMREMGVALVLANVFARLIGAFAAYGGNRIWTFSRPQHVVGLWRSAWRYALLWVGATAISTSLLAVLTHYSGNESVTKLLVEVLMVLLNFFIARYWVFR
jgi:putative flippase GtrA